ncbi:MAG: septal ring lytic transglycosylase RlpA family protein [Nitrospirae bacterium]|jgi:rare lipoprotein A|nr:septal ring lytic transglycosylase RlpA family protein [Nitrospirota bacterium]
MKYIKVLALISLNILLVSCASHYRSSYAVASWYGSEFHGKPTSSGEIFNMYANTCAHREYPFGTKLKVTNVMNNKSISCIVNDRGPFVSGRDIDLSYAAAKEIGLIPAGTSNVIIEYLGRDESYIKEVRYLSSSGPFTLQIGSFKDKSNAVRLKTALELKYKEVYLQQTSINGENYFRVRLGKFIEINEVKKLGKILANEGYSVFITKYEERV